jgi:hypothetical protein
VRRIWRPCCFDSDADLAHLLRDPVPVEADQQSTTWSLRFAQPAPYLDFNHAFNRCLWERTNGLAWGKAKADEQRYVYSAFEDAVMEETEEDAADESEDEREELRKEQNGDGSEVEESEDDIEEGASQ